MSEDRKTVAVQTASRPTRSWTHSPRRVAPAERRSEFCSRSSQIRRLTASRQSNWYTAYRAKLTS